MPSCATNWGVTDMDTGRLHEECCSCGGGWAAHGQVGDDNRTVTVCSACLQASCWQGKFFCDDYGTAGTVEKTVSELRKLNLENPAYWAELPY